MIALKDLVLYAPLLATVTMIAVALWLLWVGKDTESSQAFSFVLIARAGSLAGLTIVSVSESVIGIRVGGALYTGFAIVTAIAVLYFILVYPKRWQYLPRKPVMQGLILVVSMSLSVAVWIWPNLAIPQAILEQAGLVEAVFFAFSTPAPPLGIGPTLLDFIMASSAFILVKDYLKSGPGRRRTTLKLVALGFFAPASCSCMVAGILLKVQAGIPAPTNPSVFNWIDMGLFFGWALVLLSILGYLSLSRRAQIFRQHGSIRIFVATVLFATVLGMSTALISDLEIRIMSINAMLAFWSTIGAALVAHAVLRLSLFDIDFKLKVTIRRSTVAAFFVAVYFLVSEISATWFGDVTGSQYWGIAGAALLLLVLHPIEEIAKRLVQRLMPSIQPLEDLDRTKQLDFYRQQVDLMWMDGHLSLRDRKVLANLRGHLDLDPQMAEAIELEVIESYSDPELKSAQP